MLQTIQSTTPSSAESEPGIKGIYHRKGYLANAPHGPLSVTIDPTRYAEHAERLFHLGVPSIRWWGKAPSQEGTACTLTKLPQLAERDPTFLALARERAIVSVVEEILGPALIFRDVLLAKPPRIGAPIYYHQDASYWDVDQPERVLSAWIALDDAPREAGALEVLPGTQNRRIEHDLMFYGRRVPRPLTNLLRKGVSMAGTGDNPRTLVERTLSNVRRKSTEMIGKALPRFAELNQLQIDPRTLDMAQMLTVPAKAGDVIFFHSLLVHGSGPNLLSHPRRAYIVTYMAKNCTVGGKLPSNYLPTIAP